MIEVTRAHSEESALLLYGILETDMLTRLHHTCNDNITTVTVTIGVDNYCSIYLYSQILMTMETQWRFTSSS